MASTTRQATDARALWAYRMEWIGAIVIQGGLIVHDIARIDLLPWYLHALGVALGTALEMAAVFSLLRRRKAGPRTAVAVAGVAGVLYTALLALPTGGRMTDSLIEVLIGLLIGVVICGAGHRYVLWRVTQGTRRDRRVLARTAGAAGILATIGFLATLVAWSHLPHRQYELALGAAVLPLILGCICAEELRIPSEDRARWLIGIGAAVPMLAASSQYPLHEWIPQPYHEIILTCFNGALVSGIFVLHGVLYSSAHRAAMVDLEQELARRATAGGRQR